MFTSGPMTALTPAKAFGGQLQELGNRFDVPVGVIDIYMTKIGGEFRQFLPHVEAIAVPFDEPPSRKAVTKILKPRPTAVAPTSRLWP